MVKIKPFLGIVYNPAKIHNLSQVVCPPYDVINPQEQDYYYKLHPYNMIRLVLSKNTPQENRYKFSSRCFKEWQKEQVFIRDEKPAVYFYNQIFNIKGERKNRLGFIALLRLGEEKEAIFPHEHTRAEAKEDRFRLIKAVRANLSPIFALFSYTKRIIQRTQEQCLANASPFIDIIDKEGVRHQLWRVIDPQIIAKISANMEDTDIFIADGHHRYAVALEYRRYMRRLGHTNPQASFNYIMSYFTNSEGKGLVILPIHRMIRGLAGLDLEELKQELNKYFDIEEIADKNKFYFLMQKAGTSQHTIGMYKNKKFYLLRLKNLKFIYSFAERDKPKEYNNLDISVLNSLILRNILKLDIEDRRRIQFSHDEDWLIEEANKDPESLVFLLNPVKIEQLLSVARLKEPMPSKSTFFYPKLLSGLVIHKLDKRS